MNLRHIDYLKLTRQAAVALAFLATVLIVVPFSPLATGMEGEPWRYAMNWAVEHHLVFGRDIVFTAGPLSAIYTRAYHPATDTAMVTGALALAMALFLGFMAITPEKRRAWLVLLPLILAQFTFEAAMVMALPLLLILTAEKASDTGSRKVLVAVNLIAMACTLLPLIKGTMAIAVAACTGFAVLALWRRWRSAAAALLFVELLTLIVAWCAVGQPLQALPHFFISQLPVVSGYTVAMATSGNTWEAVLYPFFAAILLWSIVRTDLVRHWRITLGLALLFFVSFKAGFVRHDTHATIAACGLALVGLIAFLEKPTITRRGIVGISAGFIGCICLSMSYQSYDTAEVQRRLFAQLEESATGLIHRISQPDLLPRVFAQDNERIRKTYPLPDYKGDADLYPQNVAALLASRSRWNPRPAILSYTAYTPSLAKADDDHLRLDPPSRVYFQIGAIDGRYPALEDGLSWPTLLGAYTPSGFSGGYALLEHTAGGAPVSFGPERVVEGTLGKEFTLGAQPQTTWAKIDVTPTLLGRAVSTIYKMPALTLKVRYGDGHSEDFRFIPGMASAGFVLSPTVVSAEEFVALRASTSLRSRILGNRLPIGFALVGESGTRWLWNARYTVSLQKLDIAPSVSADRILLSTQSEEASATDIPTGGDCAIDSVKALDSEGRKDGLLSIRGWGLGSGVNGTPNDSLQVALVQGNKTILGSTRAQPRPDVAAHFGHPERVDVGFTTLLDTRNLHGRYDVRVVQTVAGKRLTCALTTKIDFDEYSPTL